MKIINKLSNATTWSLSGLGYAYKYELAFKMELFVASILVPTAIILANNFNELLWLLFSICLVLIVELLNSAIEAVVDRVGPEIHDLSKRAKDIGSAAVFCAILFATIVWGMFFLRLFSSHI